MYNHLKISFTFRINLLYQPREQVHFHRYKQPWCSPSCSKQHLNVLLFLFYFMVLPSVALFLFVNHFVTFFSWIDLSYSSVSMIIPALFLKNHPSINQSINQINSLSFLIWFQKAPQVDVLKLKPLLLFFICRHFKCWRVCADLDLWRYLD